MLPFVSCSSHTPCPLGMASPSKQTSPGKQGYPWLLSDCWLGSSLSPVLRGRCLRLLCCQPFIHAAVILWGLGFRPGLVVKAGLRLAQVGSVTYDETQSSSSSSCDGVCPPSPAPGHVASETHLRRLREDPAYMPGVQRLQLARKAPFSCWNVQRSGLGAKNESCRKFQGAGALS